MRIETHPLPPFLPNNATMLMLGSFPPPRVCWRMDFYYPNLQNDMWRIMGLLYFQDKHHFIEADGKGFREQALRAFLVRIGLAIYDTAYQIERLQGNATDKHLRVVKAVDIPALLQRIPQCHSIITTGEKALDTLLTQLPEETAKPRIGSPAQVMMPDGRQLTLHRLPSSSRAYPLALDKKAALYAEVFGCAGQ